MINIYKLFLDQVDFFVQHSAFTHKDASNIRSSGDLSEIAIRKFFREVIGDRFKITHGYIYSKANEKLSPQIDIIITDTLVPHSFKKFEYLDNMEIVPIESVVGIFEVKRTLTKESYYDAIQHLKKIFDQVPITKNLNKKYLPGGIELGANISGGQYSNPMFGVVSLLHISHQDVANYELPDFIDIVYSFDGYMRAFTKNGGLHANACRPVESTIRKTITGLDTSREKNLMGFVSFMLRYLSQSAGRMYEMNDYFGEKR